MAIGPWGALGLSLLVVAALLISHAGSPPEEPDPVPNAGPTSAPVWLLMGLGLPMVFAMWAVVLYLGRRR